MPKVSVIIPLYNTEKYVEQTFDSIIAQTFQDWELIIVDDCSTDGSYAIAQQYAEKESRIKLLQMPTNSGSAKIPFETGIAMASSDWIVEIGCDDHFDEDTFEKLIQRQVQSGADIVYLRMELFDDVTGDFLSSIPQSGFDYNQILAGKDAMMMTVGDWPIGANGALIKRELYLNLTTFKNPDICHMNADEYDTRELLSMARTVAFVNTTYHYRIHQNSITRKVSPKLFEPVITDRMVAELVGRVFGVESAQFSKAKSIAMNAVLGKYFMWARYAKRFSVEDRQKVDELIRDERSRYSNTEIWHSELHSVKKLLLIAPRWMVMIPITLYVRLKYRTK